MERVTKKRENIVKIKSILEKTVVEPKVINEFLIECKSAILTNNQKLAQLLLRPLINIQAIRKKMPLLNESLDDFDQETIEQAEIQTKYDVYLQKEKELVEKMRLLEEQVIPDSFNYDKISSLSNEARQKFKTIKPHTLGQASRISGVNPSDVQILMVYMGR